MVEESDYADAAEQVAWWIRNGFKPPQAGKALGLSRPLYTWPSVLEAATQEIAWRRRAAEQELQPVGEALLDLRDYAGLAA